MNPGVLVSDKFVDIKHDPPTFCWKFISIQIEYQNKFYIENRISLRLFK